MKYLLNCRKRGHKLDFSRKVKCRPCQLRLKSKYRRYSEKGGNAGQVAIYGAPNTNARYRNGNNQWNQL